MALSVVRWGTVPNSACAVYEAESVARRLNWCWQGETTAGNLEATRREHTAKQGRTVEGSAVQYGRCTKGQQRLREGHRKAHVIHGHADERVPK